MKSHKFLIISFCIIFGVHDAAITEKVEWINNFTNYLQNYNKTYQILILSVKENKSNNIEERVQSISRYIPLLQINFSNITTKQELDLSLLRKNTRITMVIIIHLSKVLRDEGKLNRIFDFTIQLSGIRTRPKCLIILPQEENSFSYQKLLQNLWHKQFLDVTILELLESNKEKENIFLNMAPGIKSHSILVHHYSPFTNSYNRFQFSKLVSWFPDKTRNVQGFEMKVGLIHVPPFAYLERNSKGELIKSSGMDVMLTKELSKAMNFKIVWDAPDDEDAWGSSESCTKENSTGLISKLMSNKLNFIGFENGRYGSCFEAFYEHSRGTKFARVSIVVPILRNKPDVVLTKWDFLYALVLLIMFLLTWFISFLILRKPRSFQLFQVASILLGISATNEPNKFIERIVFGSMLVSCLLHGPFIYSTFTKVSLEIETKPEIETIKDIVDSDLIPVIGKDYYASFYDFTEGDTRRLLEKSIRNLETGNCLKILRDEKNVVCVTRAEVANLMIENYKDSCGQPVMKILNEVLRSTASGMNMEAGSPFVERFDQIIERFIESGLVGNWQRSRFTGSLVDLKTEESCTERGSETSQVKKQILYLFLIGYTFSISAFFGEFAFAYFMK